MLVGSVLSSLMFHKGIFLITHCCTGDGEWYLWNELTYLLDCVGLINQL